MEEIKLCIIVRCTIDGETEEYERPSDVYDALNIPNTPEFTDCRVGILQKLLAFGELDLSPAYPGHSVKLELEAK